MCPQQVTVTEALLTLLQFVLLLVIGWAVDVKIWNKLLGRINTPAHQEDTIVVSWLALSSKSTQCRMPVLSLPGSDRTGHGTA